MTKDDKLQYIKVRREGGTTVISVGKLIPRHWKVVKLSLGLDSDPKVVFIRAEKVA